MLDTHITHKYVSAHILHTHTHTERERKRESTYSCIGHSTKEIRPYSADN